MDELENNYQTVLLPARPTVNKIEKHDVSSDVKALHSALKFITNKQKVINLLCSRTNRQRKEIVKAYRTCYDCELIDEFKRKFRGDFQELLIVLVTPTNEFLCRELFDALNQSGTDEDTLIQILVTISNREIFEINQKYLKNYGKSLEKDLREDLSGNFRKLMVSLSCGSRDESSVLDLYAARVDALELKRAGVDK